MKINYVIATFNGKFPSNKRDHKVKNKAFLISPNDILKNHLNKLAEIDSNISQITIMKPQSDNTWGSYYDINKIVNKINCKIEIKECENFGYSPGQFLKAFEYYNDEFDYYCFIEDDYCASMDNFDSIFQNIYQEDFKNNIGVLCSVVEGSKDYKEKAGYPIHFEGMVFVSTTTLKKLYSNPYFEKTPREMLDKIDNKIDNGFDWNGQWNSYIGGYYQLTFSHLFTLSGIEHSHYLKRPIEGKKLQFPYWSDENTYDLGGHIIFYDSSTSYRDKFTEEDINNSPIIPIQLSNRKLINKFL